MYAFFRITFTIALKRWSDHLQSAQNTCTSLECKARTIQCDQAGQTCLAMLSLAILLPWNNLFLPQKSKSVGLFLTVTQASPHLLEEG